MIISELRELLKKYNEEELRLLVAELYKAMPKKLREEKAIDRLVEDMRAYRENGKKEKFSTAQADLSEVKMEIERFVEDAYQQYYFAPNRHISKKERPKWRFKVKQYIKLLQKVRVDGSDGEIATALLIKLYEMLCYACGYYLFNSDYPFNSVGITQADLLDIIISRQLAKGVESEGIKRMIKLIINNGLDRETLYSTLIMVLIKNLKTPDAKEMALEQCKILYTNITGLQQNKNKTAWLASTSLYERQEKKNLLVQMVFRLFAILGEIEAAIEYYHTNYQEKNSEIALYVLLYLLYEYNLTDYWMREYQKAVQKGIKPRNRLEKAYQYIGTKGKMPEYI